MNHRIIVNSALVIAYYAANAFSTLNNAAVGEGRAAECARIGTNHTADVGTAADLTFISKYRTGNIAAVGIKDTAGASAVTMNIAGIGSLYISNNAFVITEDTARAAIDSLYSTAVVDAELRSLVADSNLIFTRYAADIVTAGNFSLIINGLQIANIIATLTIKSYDAADIFSSFGRQLAFVGSVINSAVISACNTAEVSRRFALSRI